MKQLLPLLGLALLAPATAAAGKPGPATVAPVTPGAVTLWAGAGSTVGGTCLGSSFLMCAEWKAWMSGATMHFLMKNTSDQAPASNTRSAFTFIGIAGGIPDPEELISFSYTGSGVWGLATNDITGFAGFGIVNKTGFGSEDGAGDPQLNGLTDGNWVEFAFTFRNNVDFSAAKIAVHDQAGPLGRCSSKAVWNAVDGSNGSTPADKLHASWDPSMVDETGQACMAPPPTSVPEPATIVLMGTGLVGLGLAARRRRK